MRRGLHGWLFELRRHGELAEGVDYFSEVEQYGLTGVGTTTDAVTPKAASAKVGGAKAAQQGPSDRVDCARRRTALSCGP